MNNKNDILVKRIINKLGTIEDEEMRELIHKLIKERDYYNKDVQIDPITGAYKKTFLKTIKNCTSVVVLRIKKFKYLENEYDEMMIHFMLRNIASHLMQKVRINDYVCYEQKGQFVITFSECDNDIVWKRVNDMIEEIQSDNKLENFPLEMEAGISSLSKYKSVEELRKEALAAIKQSTFHNTVKMYDLQKIKFRK